MISKSRSTRHPLNGCMGALERPISSDQFYVLLFLRQKQVDVLNDKDGIHWAQGVYVWFWPSRARGHKGCEVVSDADQLARLVTPDEDLRTKLQPIREKDELIAFAVAA